MTTQNKKSNEINKQTKQKMSAGEQAAKETTTKFHTLISKSIWRN